MNPAPSVLKIRDRLHADFLSRKRRFAEPHIVVDISYQMLHYMTICPARLRVDR